MNVDKNIKVIDLLQIIRESGDDFIINLDDTFGKIETNNQILLRNGVVILLCKSNGGVITIDSKEYKLSKNSVIVLPSNHIINNINSLLMRESNAIAVSEDYILNMPSPIDTSIFGYSRYLSVIKIADDKFDDLQSYYRFIYKESKEESKYRLEIIQSIFYALILEILAEYKRFSR